jgi:hypothetical protein
MIKNTAAKNLSQISTDKIFAECAAQIFIEKFPITLVCVWRAPSADFDQFLNLCDLTLKYLHILHMELVVCGDFNISHLKDSIFKQQITFLFQSYNLF